MSKLVLYTLLVWAGPLPAASSGSGFADIMRGMATGLAILGQAGNTKFPNYGSPTLPFSAVPPGYAWPGAPIGPGWNNQPWTGGYAYPSYPYRGTSRRAYNSPRILESLQGSWETNNGGLLLVRRNMARLYIERNEYQDFYIRADPRYLWMWPTKSQVSQRYEHHISGDIIRLRDEFGNTLTLRRYQTPSQRH